jgi:hypothetical protein
MWNGAPRRAVGGLEVEDRAGQRDVSGDALAGERQPRGAERNIHRVVLGEHEAEIARAVGFFLNQVERAGVTVRDLARLGQDGLDEISRVALGREPDPDRVQLGELAIEPRHLAVESPHLGGALEIGEGVVDDAGEHRRARAFREDGVPVRGPRTGIVTIDQRDDAKRRRSSVDSWRRGRPG